MVYEPLKGAELEDWRSLLERFADDSERDQIPGSLDALDNWANSEPETPLSAIFWKYLAEDPDNKLKNYEYTNGLNYHILAQWLFQNRAAIIEDSLAEEKQNKQKERILIRTLNDIADTFDIKRNTLYLDKYQELQKFKEGDSPLIKTLREIEAENEIFNVDGLLMQIWYEARQVKSKHRINEKCLISLINKNQNSSSWC